MKLFHLWILFLLHWYNITIADDIICAATGNFEDLFRFQCNSTSLFEMNKQLSIVLIVVRYTLYFCIIKKKIELKNNFKINKKRVQ